MSLTYIQKRLAIKNGSEKTDQQKRAEQREKEGGSNIAKKAPKRIEEDKDYDTARKEYLQAHALCEAGVSVHCSKNRKKSQEIHHKRRRNTKDDRINPKNFLAVCRPCHIWLGAHPQQAIALGLTELVNKKK